MGFKVKLWSLIYLNKNVLSEGHLVEALFALGCCFGVAID